MKRACKSHLRRQRRKRKGTESAFRACYDGQAYTFPVALSGKSEVSEIDGWGIYHHLNNSDFFDDKQCGFYNRFQEKKKYRKGTALKNCLAEIYTLEVWPTCRNVAGNRFAEIPFDRLLPGSFRWSYQRQGWVMPIAKFTQRGHNLFLPKMRMISARQLSHRNDSRKVCPIRKNKCFLWSYSTFCLSLHQ